MLRPRRSDSLLEVSANFEWLILLSWLSAALYDLHLRIRIRCEEERNAVPLLTCSIDDSMHGAEESASRSLRGSYTYQHAFAPIE